ncbi:MAG: DUF5309 family protein [Pseudomonadota bacterium]
MPGFDTYTQLRQAEDVQDEIYNISPIDNPVCSMSRTIQATGKLHEWTEDILQPAAKNAKVEGAAAGADTSQPVVERSNFCQIMDEVAEITGSMERVKKYGRDSEMAYQLELRYGKLANDEELAVVGAPGGTRQTAVAGNSSTAREMASFYAQVEAGHIINAAAATNTAELEDFLLAAHLAAYEDGGNPSMVVTDPGSAAYFASFALSAGRNRDIMDRTLINVIDMYVSTYGELDVVLDRNMTQTNNAMNLIDPEYTATPVLRATDDWPIAKLGDSDKRQVLREGTFATLNQRAHAIVDNVPAGLSPP